MNTPTITPSKEEELQLELFAEAEDDDQDDSPRTPFVIDNEQKADWVLGKLASIRGEQDRIRAGAAARIEQLEADYNKLYRKFGEPLAQFAREEYKRRKRKTVTLFQGSLVLRAVSSRPVVSDKDAAMRYAREYCPDAIKVKVTESLDSRRIIEVAESVMKETGEILDFIERTASGESFSITFPSSGTKEVTAVEGSDDNG